MVVMSASLFLVGNVLFAPFVYPLAKKLGLRNLVIFACSLISLGSYMRSFINRSFACVLFGQMVIGMGTCLIVNLKMQFCYNWFHPIKRPIFISLASILNIFGGGVGNMIPLIFVKANQTEVIEIKASLEHYTTVMFWIAFVVLMIVVIAFQENPPVGFGLTNQVHGGVNTRPVG
jgi:MFS family permease